jgi:hypothetical protein
MKPTEKKFVCDLISLVANAVATDTISEAEDYLVEHYQGNDNELIEHSLNVMSAIKNKNNLQYEENSDSFD